jgi:hypothetical protein
VGRSSSLSRYGRRRGSGRAVAVAALLVVVGLCLVGCGKGGHGAETDPEKGSDAEILNAYLARELTTLDAYTRGQSLLSGSMRAVARQLRAQEQAYVDAVTKTIRGLGGDTEAEAEELDFSGVKNQTGFLTLVYELESADLSSYIETAPRLFTAAPRTLDASLAAGHAQHLVLLRQGLGATPAASAPEAFDGGEVPPPGGGGPGGGG